MKQIRIYYESLEQGANYIKPIVDEVIGKDVEVQLVRRPKSSGELNQGSISALLSMITPDALITGIIDNVEVPMTLIEFTEAVTTEDHELQRTYGAIAAYLSGAYYIKICGEKQSEKEFGGAKYNPYSTPKIFIDRVGYERYIIAKWETEKGNTYTLKRNPKYPSCPPEIPILTDTIQQAVIAFFNDNKTWQQKSVIALKKKASYIAYRKKVDVATGAKELIEAWKVRRDTNLNKLRYFVTPNWIGAKINRFSHSMDPDKGILTFISFLFSEYTKVYGIYALVRPRGNDKMKADIRNITDMRTKLDIAFSMDKAGIPEWLENEIRAAAKKAKTLNDVIDFQHVWEKHRKEITENKVVMTIAFFLDGLKLNYNGITLVWDKRKLVNTTQRNFVPAFAKHFHFAEYTKQTPLIEVLGEVDEDEVTYAIVHRVLMPNGFKIVSVSYPGSQGGNAVLPNPELGKAQPREYPDVIAMPPQGTNIDVLLNESKGMFSRTAVESDLEKLLLYKKDPTHKAALKETLFVAQVIDKNKQLRNIVVGVSFGVNKEISWNPADVDFIFVVKNRKKWSILYNKKLSKVIDKTEGQTRFPQVFKCFKTDTPFLF